MATTQGVIKRKSQREKNYGLTLGEENDIDGKDIWYNGFGQCQQTEGDMVNIDYEDNEKYGNRDIKKISKVGESPEEQITEHTTEAARSTQGTVTQSPETSANMKMNQNKTWVHACEIAKDVLIYNRNADGMVNAGEFKPLTGNDIKKLAKEILSD